MRMAKPSPPHPACPGPSRPPISIQNDIRMGSTSTRGRMVAGLRGDGARQEAARRQGWSAFQRGLFACTGTRRRRCVERPCVRVWLCGVRGWVVREGVREGVGEGGCDLAILCWSGSPPGEAERPRGHARTRQSCVWLAKPEPLGSVVAWGTRCVAEGGGGDRQRRARERMTRGGDGRLAHSRFAVLARVGDVALSIRMVQIRRPGQARGSAGRD